MEIQKDFKELLESFNANNVEYMIVGGYALAFHGAPRYTGDIDLFIKPDKENAQRVMDALDEFGFGSVGIELSDLEYENKVIQLGVPPVRIDIITSISGVTWKDASASKVKGEYGGVSVHFIGLNQFIENKKSIGRKKDMADLEALGVE
jgi:predicted nucleotidyltransferase